MKLRFPCESKDESCFISYVFFIGPLPQGRRKHLKLGKHDAARALFLKKNGAFFRNKKGTSLFKAKSWGHVTPLPPGSHVYALPCALQYRTFQKTNLSNAVKYHKKFVSFSTCNTMSYILRIFEYVFYFAAPSTTLLDL